MAKTITITYTAVVAPQVNTSAPICPVMMPGNAASDSAAFDGTYYDTNVTGWGEGTSLEAFMNSVVAHPGLVAAVRKAIKDGTCVINDATSADAIYMEECEKALADQGITIAITETVEPVTPVTP